MLTPVLGNSIRDRTRPIGTGSLTRFDWFKILSPSNEYSFPKRKYIGDAVFPALNSLYNISGEASINFTTDIAFTTKYMASFDPAIIEFNTGGTVLSGSFSTSTDETSFSFNSTAELTKIYAPNLDPASFTFSSTAAAHEVFNIIDAIASFEVISDFSGMAEIYQLTTDATAVDFGLSVGSPAMAIVPTRFLTRRTDTGDPYGKLITISDISDIDIIMAGTALFGAAAAPTGILHVRAAASGDVVQTIETVTSGDDPIEYTRQYRVTTTNATVTTLATIALTASKTYMIEAKVVARRTGGAGGTAEDGAGYIVVATFNTLAGVATLIGAVAQDVVQESQAGWDCTIDSDGAGNARIRVTGATNNNVTWHAHVRTMEVGS